MTQDEIIRTAQEAGFETEDWANGTHVIVYESGREIDITNELERFAALVFAPVQQAEQELFDMDDHPPHRLCECRKCLEYFTDKAHEEALEHITDGSPCWCNPEMTYKDPINGAEVWVHKEIQMSNEEIFKAVKNSLNVYSFTAEALEMLIDNVKKEEREACAKVCDDIQEVWLGEPVDTRPGYYCAAAIRARSEK